MRNIAHVIRNRSNDTSGHFPSTAAIGIVSQGNGNAFNAWRAASARQGAGGGLWEYALELATALMNGGSIGSASSGMSEQTVFFQSCFPVDHTPVETEANKHVAADTGACAQYYYNALPTYQCVPPNQP